MTVLGDKIKSLSDKIDAAAERENVEDSEKTALKAKIDELQALVDAGNASPADEAALDAAIAKFDAAGFGDGVVATPVEPPADPVL